MKIASLSDRALVRGGMAGLLVAAFGVVAAGNAPRLVSGPLGEAMSHALFVCAGLGVLFAIVCGFVASRRAW